MDSVTSSQPFIKSPFIADMLNLFDTLRHKKRHFGVASCLLLTGESGSGKSTVVQAMMRILPPPALISGGEVLINNENIMTALENDIINFRWKKISIVMQSALNALNPVLSIRDQIHDVLKIHKGLIDKEADDRAKELLSLVDIEYDRLDSFPHQLSGGMKQRVVIAIALAIATRCFCPPEIVIPFSPIGDFIPFGSSLINSNMEDKASLCLSL